MKHTLADQLYSSLQGKTHIIWDWNGTLLNDVDHAVQVMNTLLVEHSLPSLQREHYRQIFDFPVINYYKALGFNFEYESFESLCRKFVERFMLDFRELPLIPEMKSVVLQLQSKGLSQSILSATDQENLDLMVKHFQMNDIFSYVFGIDNQFAASKIDRGHELIRISAVPLSETIIIGDTLHDLEVAKALGIDAILISHGHQCPTRLRPHHRQVIEV